MSDERPWRDGDLLLELWLGQELEKSEIAQRWDCSEMTVYRWLKKALDGTPYGHDCPDCDECFPTDRGLRQHYGQVHEGSIAGHPIICANCGTERRIPQCQIEQSEKNYCGDPCRFEAMRDPVHTVECAHCGSSLDRKEWHIEQSNNHFCPDSDCFDEWSRGITGDDHPLYKQRDEYECAWCGSDVKRRQSYPDTEKKFCIGTDCMSQWLSENRTGENSPSWKGGDPRYGPGWNDAKKEAVRERDGRVCQDPGCGRTEEDHLMIFGEKHTVHHIMKARQFDDPEKHNAMSNLITLCRAPCHRKWERMSPLRPDVAD